MVNRPTRCDTYAVQVYTRMVTVKIQPCLRLDDKTLGPHVRSYYVQEETSIGTVPAAPKPPTPTESLSDPANNSILCFRIQPTMHTHALARVKQDYLYAYTRVRSSPVHHTSTLHARQTQGAN
jgi:hypothetical protein